MNPPSRTQAFRRSCEGSASRRWVFSLARAQVDPNADLAVLRVRWGSRAARWPSRLHDFLASLFFFRSFRFAHIEFA